MKLLRPADFVVSKIDADGTCRFEAFLDRNYPGWRERQMFKDKYAGTIQRRWRIGIDGMERTAFYRKQYVEIYDEFYDVLADDTDIHQTNHALCDIEGDKTPVAAWERR